MSPSLDAESLRYDPYFDREYAELYTHDEGSSIFTFRYEENGKFFSTLSIKRPIGTVADIKIDSTLFDLETPYGYGGYLSSSAEEGFLQRAFAEYESHCKKSGIVAEFIRFHPFNGTILRYRNHLDFCSNDRPTVCIETTLSTDERRNGYSSKVRRKIRKCEKELNFHQTDDLDTFKALYKATMMRNKAARFYHFNDDFFDSLFRLPYTKLYAVSDDEGIVSIALILLGKDILHIHFSANRSEKMHKNGNYLLFDRLCDIARQSGCRFCFIGGGRSNDPEDTLLRFKRQFSPHRLPFFIGGKVFDQITYKELLSIHQKRLPHLKSAPYFLKYRLLEDPE